MKNQFNIKEVSKLTGLSEHTLRFYEKQLLIKNISWDEHGYRIYSDFDIEWINFLIKVKNTGMQLKDLQHYAVLMEAGDSTVFERDAMLIEHRKRVESQIADLKNTLTKIDDKLFRYQLLKQQLQANKD